MHAARQLHVSAKRSALPHTKRLSTRDDTPVPMKTPMNSNRDRWLQLALVAVSAALEDVECTDAALTEALFAGLPGLKIDDVTAAAVAEALRRSGTLQEAAAMLDRSRGFVYDSLKRRRREWLTADWTAYGADLRRRRLLAGWSLSELGRRIHVSVTTLRHIEQARGTLRPSALTLAKLSAALGLPQPPTDQKVDPHSSDGEKRPSAK